MRHGSIVILAAWLTAAEFAHGRPQAEAFPSPVAVTLMRGLCEGISNTQECAQAIERDRLTRTDAVERTEQGLCFALLGGGSTCIPDDAPAEWPSWFSYLGTIPAPLLHVLWAQHPEGNSILLVHARTGHHTWVDVIPVPSPDGRYLAASSVDLEVQYNPNRLTVFAATGDTLAVEWSIEPHSWGPGAVQWLSNTEFALERLVFDTTTLNTIVSDTVVVVRDGGEWRLRPQR